MSGDVLRLVTPAERAAEADREYIDAAVAEASSMIERAAQLLAEREAGHRAVSVAIAIAFEDGSYGSLIPLGGDHLGHLLGAVVDMQYRLLKLTNEEP